MGASRRRRGARGGGGRADRDDEEGHEVLEQGGAEDAPHALLGLFEEGLGVDALVGGLGAAGEGVDGFATGLAALGLQVVGAARVVPVELCFDHQLVQARWLLLF